jgi:hypothetical protein
MVDPMQITQAAEVCIQVGVSMEGELGIPKYWTAWCRVTGSQAICLNAQLEATTTESLTAQQ